jgi:ABC-type molybdate transport system permease subunit
MIREEEKILQKTKIHLSRVKKKLKIFLMTFGTFIMFSTTAFASDVQNSKLAKGTEALINDITIWLMVLAPIVSTLFIIYFFIRRSAADEMDQKKWNNRIVVAIVSCIGAVLASATLNLIIGYYT